MKNRSDSKCYRLIFLLGLMGCAVFAVSGFTSVTAQNLIVVPSPGINTITDALNAVTVNNTTILVKPGTYQENLVIKNPPNATCPIITTLQITSYSLSNKAIIDGSGNPGPTVTFDGTISIGVIGNGFSITHMKITNGTTGAPGGGGILCRAAAPTIKNNEIYGNNTTQDGGGILCKRDNTAATPASAIIDSNTIHDNTAEGFGGGICCTGWINQQNFTTCDPQIINNQITENSANNGGGIAAIDNALPTIEGNQITSDADVCGGGVYFDADCRQRNQVFTIGPDNHITDCTAGSHGGGIYFYNSVVAQVYLIQFDVIENVIGDNDAGCGVAQLGYGGGVYCYSSHGGIFTNNVVEDNTAQGDDESVATGGGGIFYEACSCASGTDPTFTINRFVNNEAISGFGGGAVFQGMTYMVLEKNIFRANKADLGGGGACINLAQSDSRVINNLFVSNEVAMTNQSAIGGGGIYLYGGIDTRFNTVIYNSVAAGGAGGGVYCAWAEPLGSSIFYYNTLNGNPDQIGGSPSSVTYCDVQGGWPDPTCISNLPNFAGGAQWFLYRLSNQSIGLWDGADPNTTGVPTDFEGQSRPLRQYHDIGWDELP